MSKDKQRASCSSSPPSASLQREKITPSQVVFFSSFAQLRLRFVKNMFEEVGGAVDRWSVLWSRNSEGEGLNLGCIRRGIQSKTTSIP